MTASRERHWLMADLRAAAIALLLLTGSPAVAQAPKQPDLTKPLEIRTDLPLCLNLRSLDDALALAMQGAIDMAQQLPDCFALRQTTRVFVMETRGLGRALRVRVRWRHPSGRMDEAWTFAELLNNVGAQ